MLAAILIILAVLRGILHYGEQYCNHFSLNEGVILKSLKESCKNTTAVLVSHRKSTMNLADVVYEMDHGRIS